MIIIPLELQFLQLINQILNIDFLGVPVFATSAIVLVIVLLIYIIFRGFSR